MGASSSGARSFRPRLTQEEKSAETRRRLLDAAIACLVERGYSNTTTSEIAERAGLSRGAQLYHFPRKEELLTSAVEHLFELMLGEMKQKVGRLTNNNDRRALAIDLLWESANGRMMTAWIELVVASRTDAYLRESVRAANDRAWDFIDRSFKELFPRPAGTGSEYELIPQLVFMLFDGMALSGKTVDPKRNERVLTLLKTFKF
jgi:AcrR family transcriptional regulator